MITHELGTLDVPRAKEVICVTVDCFKTWAMLSDSKGCGVNNWSQLQSTTDFIVATASVTGIPVTELVVTKQGGKPEQQGTWAHLYVAIK